MKKSIMRLNLSVFELSDLINKIIGQGANLIFNYTSKSDDSLGLSYSFELEYTFYNKGSLKLITNNEDTINVLVPDSLRDNIECNIIHRRYMEVDYDELSDREKQDYLYDQLDEDNPNYKTRIRDSFELSFGNYNTEFNIGVAELYGIIGSLGKRTVKSIELNGSLDEDNKVDIDGFEESVDNASED